MDSSKNSMFADKPRLWLLDVFLVGGRSSHRSTYAPHAATL